MTHRKRATVASRMASRVASCAASRVASFSIAMTCGLSSVSLAGGDVPALVPSALPNAQQGVGGGLVVVPQGCFGHDARTASLAERLLGRTELGLRGTLELSCFRTFLGFHRLHEWALVEVDAQLRPEGGGEAKVWRAAATMRARPDRRNPDAAELAANVIALAITREPNGQPPESEPRYSETGERILRVHVQASNAIPGSCDYVAGVIDQINRTAVVDGFVQLEVGDCEVVLESSLDSFYRGADTAAAAIDTQTDLIVQLSTGGIWSSDESAVIGRSGLLGALPVVILKALRPPDPGLMGRVLAHEVGHLVGLPHVDTFDVMYPSERGRGQFTTTAGLYRAGLRRRFTRPWRAPMRMFDDLCAYVEAWQGLRQGGRVLHPDEYVTGIAAVLLETSLPAEVPCIERLLADACHEGGASSCLDLGQMYSAGYRVEREPARAASFFRSACELESGTGCRELAALELDRSLAEPHAAADGVRWARRAVELHEAMGRVQLGDLEVLVDLLIHLERCEEARAALAKLDGVALGGAEKFGLRRLLARATACGVAVPPASTER